MVDHTLKQMIEEWENASFISGGKILDAERVNHLMKDIYFLAPPIINESVPGAGDGSCVYRVMFYMVHKLSERVSDLEHEVMILKDKV